MMDALIGRALVTVERLGWHQAGGSVDLGVGPVHLVFEGGRGILLEGRSDWSLELTETHPGDRSWWDGYDYDWNGSRWALRDASGESPFAPVIHRRLSALEPLRNEVDEVTGLGLDFDGRALTLRTWEGEVTT
ncbi:hypothetical protein [Actinoplanes xinjiangensis]|uniref:Uncharacterized protein n=1 Tax=Actinoplanes xinjiangensis TaxID=512350 RepID=A0A316FF81_9ACTN|nr:hypothetical protein [Actinoplanes xinjiangensis]PWK47013.1 hypothetical protein BC793_108127 [Actinoplanes xinjiangensis]GIF40172.1 hypothetical protein Axi01nite_44830 [Actinoplanes xinjiangensis]